MNIGFDAKRAYQNNTGLGHYSRTLITSLAEFYPGNEYFLFAPKLTDKFDTVTKKNIHPVTPEHFPSTVLTSAWRSKWVMKDIRKNNIDLYHGLSHEIPVNIHQGNIRSVVTMHDLIFERYPEQFKKIDVAIYRKKFRYACAHADSIIAISEQTKDDLVNMYSVPSEKISVCYQACNPIFEKIISPEERQLVRQRYQLPDQYFLSVGSIIERKNLLTICQAIHRMNDKLPHPLVVIGDGGKYKEAVKRYIAENKLDGKIIFLNESIAAQAPGFKESTDFPAIYQMATALIYPSSFEGFGLPVLEALWSNTPVITSNVSCMPETGGDAALYVSPLDDQQMADAMLQVATDAKLADGMKKKGLLHAQRFSRQATAAAVMEVYKKTCDVN
ncbi:MAG: glycosyl transferase, group 1 family protein [Ferruginibacter sp.]|nr:glycosyl transferase, group 1 family protein [Ferruginibacter sp.]